MAAYRGLMTHVTCRLTAENRDQLRNPTLGNRLWATFTFLFLEIPESFVQRVGRVEVCDTLSTRSTQPCISPGSLNRVPASTGVRAGMSPLPGGR